MPFPVGEPDAHEVNPLGQPFEADGKAVNAFGTLHLNDPLSEEVARLVE